MTPGPSGNVRLTPPRRAGPGPFISSRSAARTPACLPGAEPHCLARCAKGFDRSGLPPYSPATWLVPAHSSKNESYKEGSVFTGKPSYNLPG